MGSRSNLRWLIQRMTGRSTACTHLSLVRDVRPTTDGCAQCLAAGDSWVHLRSCMTCGQVGCCDSSRNRHARRHAETAGHPIARSAEPGEDWAWCFVDQTLVDTGAA